MKKKLQIGGDGRLDGWETYGPHPAKHFDHVGGLADLSRYPDAHFGEILALQVVQRLDHRGELDAALREWRRVLEPGGRISISVPDLDALAGLILARDRLSAKDRFEVMQMAFGGRGRHGECHRVGLNEEFLASFLIAAGFVNVRRVASLGPLAGGGILVDFSLLDFRGSPVGLNLVAHKPAA